MDYSACTSVGEASTAYARFCAILGHDFFRLGCTYSGYITPHFQTSRIPRALTESPRPSARTPPKPSSKHRRTLRAATSARCAACHLAVAMYHKHGPLAGPFSERVVLVRTPVETWVFHIPMSELSIFLEGEESSMASQGSVANL